MTDRPTDWPTDQRTNKVECRLQSGAERDLEIPTSQKVIMYLTRRRCHDKIDNWFHEKERRKKTHFSVDKTWKLLYGKKNRFCTGKEAKTENKARYTITKSVEASGTLLWETDVETLGRSNISINNSRCWVNQHLRDRPTNVSLKLLMTASPPEKQQTLQPTLSSIRRHKSPH